MDKNEFDLIVVVLLKNTAMVLIFALLAIVFDKWWISLISPLFFTSISKGEK